MRTGPSDSSPVRAPPGGALCQPRCLPLIFSRFSTKPSTHPIPPPLPFLRRKTGATAGSISLCSTALIILPPLPLTSPSTLPPSTDSRAENSLACSTSSPTSSSWGQEPSGSVQCSRISSSIQILITATAFTTSSPPSLASRTIPPPLTTNCARSWTQRTSKICSSSSISC